MRKSFHSLSGIVQSQMHKSLTTEDVYIFINKTRNRIKLLHYERGGLVLYSKIIDQGRIKDLTSNTNGSVNWQTLLQAIEASFNNPAARRREFAIKQKICKHCSKNII